MSDTKPKTGPENIKIGVRRETREKYDRIAKAMRWSLVETADALADSFLERGLDGKTNKRTRKPAAA